MVVERNENFGGGNNTRTSLLTRRALFIDYAVWRRRDEIYIELRGRREDSEFSCRPFSFHSAFLSAELMAPPVKRWRSFCASRPICLCHLRSFFCLPTNERAQKLNGRHKLRIAGRGKRQVVLRSQPANWPMVNMNGKSGRDVTATDNSSQNELIQSKSGPNCSPALA